MVYGVPEPSVKPALAAQVLLDVPALVMPVPVRPITDPVIGIADGKLSQVSICRLLAQVPPSPCTKACSCVCALQEQKEAEDMDIDRVVAASAAQVLLSVPAQVTVARPHCGARPVPPISGEVIKIADAAPSPCIWVGSCG